MVSKTHVSAGVEAFYTETGETCMKTPDGKQIRRTGVNLVVPEGVSMELMASGTEVRRGMILVLHDSSKPATPLVSDWKPKGLCRLGL
jgi:quercetin dioxygenase-like cupin family protein